MCLFFFSLLLFNISLYRTRFIQHAPFNDEFEAERNRNPCTSVTEEKKKFCAVAKIFFLLFDGSARKRKKPGEKYIHNITNDICIYMFWIGEAPGATSFLMARIC